MLALGLFAIVTGLSMVALGVAFQKGENPAKGGKKGKKKKLESERRSPPPNYKAIFGGAVVLILAGIGFVVAHFLK